VRLFGERVAPTLVDDAVADPVLPNLGLDPRHIVRGGVGSDARDFHLGVPPVRQVFAAHEGGVQTPERETQLSRHAGHARQEAGTQGVFANQDFTN
jgi:hypothetical protein